MRLPSWRHSLIFVAISCLFVPLLIVLAQPPALPALAPQYGGTLRYPASEPTSLDPAQATSFDEYGILMQVMDGLTQFDQNVNVIPAISFAWLPSPDAKTWTFNLRNDIYFHNGRQVKAADFVYSWDRARTAGGGNILLFGNIKSFTATSDFTFTVTLTNPNAAFPVLATQPLFFVIPSEAAATIATNPVGTGAFKFVSWTPGSRILLQKNPNYFGGAAFIDGVNYNFYANTNAEYAAFQTGQLDVTEIPTATWPSIKTDPNVITSTIMVMQGYGLDMSVYTDARVRKAFQRAINRSLIITNSIIAPYNPLPLGNGIVSPGKGSYNNSDINIPYDPSGALSLLAAAGWTDTNNDGILDNGAGTNLKAVIHDSSNLASTTHVRAQMVANSLRYIGGGSVGVSATLTTTFAAETVKNASWLSDYPDPDDDLSPYEAGGIFDVFASRFHYNSATFNNLLLSARSTLTESARNTFYHSADARLVITDAVTISLYYGAMTPLLKKPFVHDVRITAQGSPVFPMRYVWLSSAQRLFLPIIQVP